MSERPESSSGRLLESLPDLLLSSAFLVPPLGFGAFVVAVTHTSIERALAANQGTIGLAEVIAVVGVGGLFLILGGFVAMWLREAVAGFGSAAHTTATRAAALRHERQERVLREREREEALARQGGALSLNAEDRGGDLEEVAFEEGALEEVEERT